MPHLSLTPTVQTLIQQALSSSSPWNAPSATTGLPLVDAALTHASHTWHHEADMYDTRRTDRLLDAFAFAQAVDNTDHTLASALR